MSLCIHIHSHAALSLVYRTSGLCPLFFNSPAMQLSSVQSSLIWLLLTALAIAATPPVTGVTSIGTGPLSLINTVNLKANSIAHCRHDDDPGHYTSSLNYTFPDTPPLPQSFLESVGFNESEGSYPFDCFFDISVVVVEVRCMSRISESPTPKPLMRSKSPSIY